MSNSADCAVEKDKVFLERTKLFRDHVQGVLALATGALVLSVTFLHDVGERAVDKPDLKYSWIFFGISILFGVAYNYLLTIYTQVQRDGFRIALGWVSALMHALFLVGILFLTLFGISNLH